MKNIYRTGAGAAILAGTLGLVTSFQNCSNEKFSAASDLNVLSGGQDPYTGCTITSGQTLKIVVVVDNSGSTYYTDPTANGVNHPLVVNPLASFVNANSNNANIKYSLIYFSDITGVPVGSGGNPNAPKAVALTNNGGNNQKPAFVGASAMTTAIQQYASMQGLGNTPYFSAFDMIANAISNDPDFISDPSHQNYVVLFISDGLPTDNGNGANFENSEYYDKQQAEIVALAPTQISFNTSYVDILNATTAQALATQTGYPINDFYDPDSQKLLQEMAVAGGGIYTDINSDSYGISTVITAPYSQCPH